MTRSKKVFEPPLEENYFYFKASSVYYSVPNDPMFRQHASYWIDQKSKSWKFAISSDKRLNIIEEAKSEAMEFGMYGVFTELCELEMGERRYRNFYDEYITKLEKEYQVYEYYGKKFLIKDTPAGDVMVYPRSGKLSYTNLDLGNGFMKDCFTKAENPEDPYCRFIEKFIINYEVE